MHILVCQANDTDLIKPAFRREESDVEFVALTGSAHLLNLKLSQSPMLRKICSTFSVYSNQHQRAKVLVNGKEVAYDHNVHKYSPSIQAYLQKRWTRKEEISGRMYVIEQIASVQPLLSWQRLYPLKRLYDESRLQRMHENREISSPFIISIASEDHFKPMMDEYTKKVLINGSMPPLLEFDNYKTIKTKIINLYRTFFFGDELSELEKELEFRYLGLKQNKYFKYQASQKPAERCIWTFSQQRRVEMMRNWRARDVDLYDDFRPIYEDIVLDSKLKTFEELARIDGMGTFQRLFFQLFEGQRYKQSKKRLMVVAQYLFTRTLLYTNSLEFLRILQIPHDFHIELALVNIHVWLLCNRLKQLNTRNSVHLSKLLLKSMLNYTQQQVQKIHMRKKNDLMRDIEAYMQSSRDYLELHFNRNPETIKNNYFKLDALVWSIAFFEKVPRYSNQVYLMAEYLKANHDFLNAQPYEVFDHCNVEFDVFKIGFDYQEKLLTVNPPLSEEEFTKEFLSDKKKKKYYYANDELRLQMEPKQQSLLARRLEIFNENLMYLGKKYYNLSTFDHFSAHEEQKKQQNQQEKYIWNLETSEDSVELRKQFMKKRVQAMEKCQ